MRGLVWTVFLQGQPCFTFPALGIILCFLEQWPLMHQIFVSIVLTTNIKIQKEASNMTPLILFLVYTDLCLKTTCDYKNWINIEKVVYNNAGVALHYSKGCHSLHNGWGWCPPQNCLMHSLHGPAQWHHLLGGLICLHLWSMRGNLMSFALSSNYLLFCPILQILLLSLNYTDSMNNKPQLLDLWMTGKTFSSRLGKVVI